MADVSTFLLLDDEYFVPPELRVPGPEFRDRVVEDLPEGAWRLLRDGIWTHAIPDGWRGRGQGWKLHVSATPDRASEVLGAVAGVLATDPAAWKFAADATVLRLLLAKNWPREGGGKFITIYPADDDQFRRLAAALGAATRFADGPYILSDRRVPESRVVFYRYGQHEGQEETNARGERVQQMVDPGGATVRDARRGHYQVPDWAADPYGAGSVRTVDDDEKKVTLNGRYRVESALSYSNTGGVYRATDLRTGDPVVVREARPHVGYVAAGADAVALLHQEAEILRRMEATGWTPRPVEVFQVWEHHYLAMEEVRGTPLRDHALRLCLRRRRVGSPRRAYESIRRIVGQLCDALEDLHRHDVIVRDLTATNVLLQRDGRIRLIDFEYAWLRDGELPPARGTHTPGFAPAAQAAGADPSEADDYHALGAVIVELCSLMAGGLGLNRDGILSAARMMAAEFGLPAALLDVAAGLLAPEPARRWGGSEVRARLAATPAASVGWRAPDPDSLAPTAEAGLEERAETYADAVVAWLEAVAGPHREETLFPATPQAHRTNTVSAGAGACGPVELVRRVRGTVPGAWLDWIERQAARQALPPGLQVGAAGVALVLADCGRDDAARAILRDALDSPLLASEFDLHHGAAGVGLAALVLAERWGADELREEAGRIGRDLLRRATRGARGRAWRDPEGRLPSGLAEGSAGVALFLLYLAACTGDDGARRGAADGLAWEFAQARRRAGMLFWPSSGGRRKPMRSPHLYFGTAGILTAAARYRALTGDDVFDAGMREGARTLAFRWTNKLWQDFGYAGWGEALLDLHAVLGDPVDRVRALRMVEALLPHAVRTRHGTAFPGGALNRVAADFGMGASGIALFLHRAAEPGRPRAFLPDHLLPGGRLGDGARRTFSASPARGPGTSDGGGTRPRGRRGPHPETG